MHYSHWDIIVRRLPQKLTRKNRPRQKEFRKKQAKKFKSSSNQKRDEAGQESNSQNWTRLDQSQQPFQYQFEILKTIKSDR